MDGSRSYRPDPQIVVIGAGIAGLAATLSLAARGVRVLLLERHAHLGGKIRTTPSIAGPVAAGPTVLTLRGVFEDLFEQAGARLCDHVRMIRQDVVARHYWPDGTRLDLFADHDQTLAEIAGVFGPRAARDFDRFQARARRLFDGFDKPMMRAAAPGLWSMNRVIAGAPRLAADMAPLASLRSLTRRAFREPKLAQVFSRYATYVGGLPHASPALLALIWQAEAAGVWAVEGGLHRLATAIAELAEARGAHIETDVHVTQIVVRGGRATGVRLADGRLVSCAGVLHAGDPRALATGMLGRALKGVAPQTRTVARSLSARVYSFAGQPQGPALSHHNVLFDDDPDAEFTDLARGVLPRKPSLYLCAMDRGMGGRKPGAERFEIICNAPALPHASPPEDLTEWHQLIMQRMARHGISFTPMPCPRSITTEARFADMFPASLGALYGQSPHGLTAGLRRPTTRTAIRGLYLAGGGCHPGAGVPMATLSARHAVEAILSDRISGSTSVPTGMPGGMSTG